MRGLLVGFFGLVALATSSNAQTVWQMPTEYPATAIPGEGVAMFAKLVTERSGGRLAIQPSFNAAMGIKSAEMILAVQQGKVPAADAFAGALGSVHALFGLSSLPFLATSVEAAQTLADAAARAIRKWWYPRPKVSTPRHGRRRHLVKGALATRRLNGMPSATRRKLDAGADAAGAKASILFCGSCRSEGWKRTAVFRRATAVRVVISGLITHFTEVNYAARCRLRPEARPMTRCQMISTHRADALRNRKAAWTRSARGSKEYAR